MLAWPANSEMVMTEITEDQRLALLESTMREYSDTLGDHHWQAAEGLKKLRQFLNTDVMQKPEIGEVLERARDLIEAGTDTLEDEIAMLWDLVGALSGHVNRAEFDEIMIKGLHQAQENMQYAPQDEENGDWNV
jgi:hypothetical protein